MEFSPDGRWLVTFSHSPATRGWEFWQSYVGSPRLWAAATGRPVTPPVVSAGISTTVIFTRDSSRLFILPFEPIVLELPSGRPLDSTEWRGIKMFPCAVTADGQRFATINKREVRVYDALTGEPVTPPLRHESELYPYAVTFSPDGGLLLAKCGEHAQLWPLPKEARPVEELVLLAQLLSGRGIDASGTFAERSSADSGSAWQRLRSMYPASFAVALDQVRVWRERIVESSEKEERWFTAAFHLDQLVKENPNEEALRLRHARARDQAAMEVLK